MKELIDKNKPIGDSYKLLKTKASKFVDKIMEDSNAKRLERKRKAEERVNRKIPRQANPAMSQLKQAKGKNGLKLIK